MWNPFTVVDASHDDPTVYPTLSPPASRLPFELEPTDGEQLNGLRPRTVSVLTHTGRGWTQTWQEKDLDFVVAITASRVVIYCEKFTKGGGWSGFGVGGLAFAGAANLVSHARAAARRQGRLLVAQIRYPWLNQVVAVDGQGGGRLRLGFDVDSASHRERLAVELVTDRRTRALEIGQYIAHSAARLRLDARPDLDAEARQYFERVAAAPGQGTDPAFPGAWDLPQGITVGALGSLPEAATAPVPPAPVAVAAVSGRWLPDPSGRHDYRFHDGHQWTSHVSTNGVTLSDHPPHA